MKPAFTRISYYLIALLIFLLPFTLDAQTIDSSFGTNGILTSRFPFSSGSIINAKTFAPLVTRDNRILLLQQATVNAQLYIEKKTHDGLRDSTFGTNGYSALLPFQYGDAILQPDEKILVTGFASAPSSRGIFLARFNTDGTLDRHFGENGIVKSTIGSIADSAFSIALFADKKILIAGNSTGQNGKTVSLIIRYDSTGALDTQFGTNGIQVGDYGTNTTIRSIGVSPDGKILAVHYSYARDNAYLITRYNASGLPDSAFNNTGYKIISSSSLEPRPNQILILDDGRFYVSGDVVAGLAAFQSLGFIQRFKPNGSADSSWNSSGTLTVPYNIPSLLRLRDGSLVASHYDATTTRLIQYDTTGQVLSQNTTDFSRPPILYYYPKLAMIDSVKIFTTASFTSSVLTFRFRIPLAPDGSASSSPPFTQNQYQRIYPIADGRLYLLAVQPNSAPSAVPFSFHQSNGGLINQSSLFIQTLVAVQPDGRYITAQSGGTLGPTTFRRFLPDGTADAGFGSNGAVSIFTGREGVFNVAITADGNIFTLGQTQSRKLIVNKLNANGQIDMSFGTNGAFEDSIDVFLDGGQIRIKPDNKILIAGYRSKVNNEIQSTFGLLQLNDNGQIDQSFANAGTFVFNWPNKLFYNDLEVLGDGSLIAAVQLGDAANNLSATVARITPQGSLDPAFHFQYNTDKKLQIEIRNPDQLLVGTDTLTPFGNRAILIKGFKTNGTVDTEFGENGTLIPDLGFGNQNLLDLKVQGDYLYAIGGINRPDLQALAVRYLLNPAPARPVGRSMVQTSEINKNKLEQGKFNVLVGPNPSSGPFNIIVESDKTGMVSARVIDVPGRELERKLNLQPNTPFELGEHLPRGIYFIEIRQGYLKKLIKVVKND